MDMPVDVPAHLEQIQRDGITALKSALSIEWVERMHEDVMTAFWKAIQRPGGAVGRGPRRWYVEVHPQDIAGFVELATHPFVTGISEAVLGPKYEIVELGFDVPFQGARFQPWHRDFPSPPETWSRFAERGVKKYPKRGDLSARSALTGHRGTAHLSAIARPVLVLGVDAPGAGHAALHDMMVTPDFFDALPAGLREHLVCRVVDELVPVTQKHDIEGLVLGVDEMGQHG